MRLEVLSTKDLSAGATVYRLAIKLAIEPSDISSTTFLHFGLG